LGEVSGRAIYLFTNTRTGDHKKLSPGANIFPFSLNPDVAEAAHSFRPTVIDFR
jgi:hypothetical protein